MDIMALRAIFVLGYEKNFIHYICLCDFRIIMSLSSLQICILGNTLCIHACMFVQMHGYIMWAWC